MTLALLGDMHGRTYQDVINSMEKHQPDVILIVGDILYGTQPLGDRSPLVAQPCQTQRREGQKERGGSRQQPFSDSGWPSRCCRSESSSPVGREHSPVLNHGSMVIVAAEDVV